MFVFKRQTIYDLCLLYELGVCPRPSIKSAPGPLADTSKRHKSTRANKKRLSIPGEGFLAQQTTALQGYYGTKIADLTELHHGVSGSVYAVDARTLFLKNFNYDGEGPAAYFYVGNTRAPSNKGAHRLRDERGRAGVLRRYRNEDITLSLPEGKTLRDIRWFAVWCDDFSVNFGDVQIRNDLDFPRPTKIAGLSGVHDVTSDNIVIVDAQTLLVPNFSYDGEAPDAKFWVGRGPAPTSQGIRIPDENGKETPLRRYDKKTIVLTLPGDLTVFDIGHFGVWCEAFTVDFGHVRIPDQINVPPSLKMLGISPQVTNVNRRRKPGRPAAGTDSSGGLLDYVGSLLF
uniref:DM13 domain-containing protein n=1 Tax=Anopheles culicifacies TaxID=139723 RepID=A0A182MK65_9DIPT